MSYLTHHIKSIKLSDVSLNKRNTSLRKRRVIKGEFPTFIDHAVANIVAQHFRPQNFKPTYSTSVNSDNLQESSTMRLLHSLTLAFEEFEDEKKPEYAILSHRWGSPSNEVSYQDMLNQS
jgi:hypothetical protein